MASRADNAVSLALLPLRLVALVLSMVYMAATAPLLFVAVVVLLVPAEAAWALSLPVGVFSPRAGARLASGMEPASDRLEAVMWFVWAPLGWLGDLALG